MFDQILAFYADHQDVIKTWVAAVGGIVLAAKSVTVLTPTTVDNKIVDAILTVLNFLALNVLKDKNADAKDVKKDK